MSKRITMTLEIIQDDTYLFEEDRIPIQQFLEYIENKGSIEVQGNKQEGLFMIVSMKEFDKVNNES